jgi:hypothetical protein
MSFWKYIIKTNFEQKKSDWTEFQELRLQAEDAKSAMLAARGRISTMRDKNLMAYSRPYACINYYFDDKKVMQKTYCPLFVECECQSYYKNQCEWAEKNTEYHDACDKADELYQAVNKFWANKFAHIK